MKKFASILLAMILVLAMAVPAMAAGTGTITITPPTGVDASATNTYKIYKVFDADGNGSSISYKLVEGKTTAPAGFTVDAAGNVTYAGAATDGKLTADDIAAIAAYVTEADLVDTVTSTGTTPAVSKALPNGYYYITTSTGTVVTIDSTNPNVEVIDKNTVPTIDKDITKVDVGSFDTDGKKALAQVGTKVEYTATITVGKGAKNYVFHDKMSDGLEYNDDATVTGVDADKYTIKETPDAGDTITITFVNGIAENTTITIKYSATVTSDALTVHSAKNTATIDYGDGYTTESTTEVYNAKFTVTKQDGNQQPLAGAGFVIKNAEGKYYKYTAATETTAATVTWYDLAEGETLEDAIKEGKVTEYTSDANGAVPAFTGLANGTYTLVESTVPTGYNKAADQPFTIAEHNYETTNLEQSATVTNQSGTELPSTGGMGTTVLYVAGGILVLAAVIVLITKKRMAASK